MDRKLYKVLAIATSIAFVPLLVILISLAHADVDPVLYWMVTLVIAFLTGMFGRLTWDLDRIDEEFEGLHGTTRLNRLAIAWHQERIDELDAIQELWDRNPTEALARWTEYRDRPETPPF